MPVRLRLDLASDGAIATPSPEQLHAVACTLLDEDHDHRSSFKAFSVQGSRATDGGWQLELGLVDDSLLRRLEQRLHQHRGAIRFGRDALSVRHVSVQCQDDWDALADAADSRASIGLRFITPTHFRRGSKSNLLPLPSAVFGHWRQRWSQVAGVAPHCPFDDRGIHVTRLEVRTEHASYRGRPTHGIVGRVTYDLRDLPPEHRAALDALAQLAPYAGCGSRTTAGFGVVDVFYPGETRSAPASQGKRRTGQRP